MNVINFLCEHCGQPLEIDGTSGGEIIACPTCSTYMTVPSATPVCPNCHKVAAFVLNLRGSFILCLNCRKEFPAPREIYLRQTSNARPHELVRFDEEVEEMRQAFNRRVGAEAEIRPTASGFFSPNSILNKLVSWILGGILLILIITPMLTDIYDWTIRKTEDKQQVEATASSRQKDGWVSGIPKESQVKMPAQQGTHKLGKKYSGLDGQEALSYVELNNGTVIYSKPITESEASALARFLVPQIFDGTKTGIVLSYSDGNYILGKNASEEETTIDGFHKAYALLAREVSAQVFQGKPVTICFFDKELNILSEISDSDGKKEFKDYQKSLAYQRGYEHGQRMGKQDREMASYNHLWPDSPDNSIFRQVAHLAGCDPGTPEYGDFAEGYDLGYRAAR